MKKIILGLMLSFIGIPIYACHVDSEGWCSGNAYFETRQFNNASIFQFRYLDSTNILFQYVTKSTGATDTLFSLPQKTQNSSITIQFRYKAITDADYNDWQSVVSADSLYSGCMALPVNLINISVQQSAGIYKVNFTNEDEGDANHYDIKFSTDTHSWDTLKTVTAGQHNYSLSIAVGLGLSFLPLLIGFKKKRLVLGILLALTVFISCQKANMSSAAKNYKFMKISAVSNNGTISDSEIKSF